MYHLRDKNGNLKASFSNRRANEIINNLPGFFKEMTYEYTGKVTVFEISADRSFSIADLGFKIFLWTGDRLIPVKE